ncbi:TonB-dependent receptor [Bacteroides stercorirosoris]|jgi:TonB-linked SusC/RagA family outer membrane protein|uniref:SusC/RagA family TonB-linked outer membrane protein n=1 Tax=Bacteroides stercorirosoris TaxID=871324 RepID=UPI000ABD029F|nr:TonB-dependent receptor [Bacteroides stercorirosoris]
MKDTTRMSVPLLRQLIMSAMFLASTLSVWAQAGNHVTGNVTDVTGEPMTGVSVVEKGTTNGVVTGLDGSFRLNVKQGAILRFSFIGYKEQEIPAVTNSMMKVVMQEDLEQLEEVVVVGYGTQKRANLTGAVATMDSKQLASMPNTSIANSLAGMLPGLIATNNTGKPGSSASISIRGKSTWGNNSVLTVVDGIVRDFKDLDANEVENITILKDASAGAIYGARAANGVILVTTKRGMSGKPRFSYNGRVGMTQPTRFPRLMNAYEYASTYNDGLQNMGIKDTDPRYFTNEQLASYADGSVGTDWWKLCMQDFSFQQAHNLTVNGGTDAVKYFFSLGYTDQEGMFHGSGYTRYNFRSNVDATITKYLTISVNVDAYLSKAKARDYSEGKIFDNIIQQRPFLTAYNQTTGLPINTTGEHPGEMLKTKGYNNHDYNNFYGTVSFKHELPFVLKGLSVSGLASYRKYYDFQKTFSVPYTTYDFNDNNEVTGTKVNGADGLETSLKEYFGQSQEITYNLSLNYAQKFGKHDINVLLLTEGFVSNKDNLEGYRTKYSSDAIDQLFAGGTDEMSTTGTGGEDARLGYVGRINYNYAERYLVEVSARYDGSANFPKGKRFGFFPAFSLGWRLSEEEFWKNMNLVFVDQLKLRGSYGLVGNDRVTAFQYLDKYTYTTKANAYGAIFDGKHQQSILYGTYPNYDITWEKAKVMNLGLDAILWNGKLGVEFDYFRKKTVDILRSRVRSIPGTFGRSLPHENYARVDNQGFELILSHHNRVGKVNYGVRGNVAFANNKAVVLDEAANAAPYERYIGYPLDYRTGLVAMGIFQTEEEVANAPLQYNDKTVTVGDIRYADLNGDGVVNDYDKTILSYNHETPKLTYGLFLNADWNGFDISALLQGAAKVNVMLKDEARNFFTNGGYSNNYAFMTDYWTPENRNAEYPRAWLGANSNNNRDSSFWLKEAGYLRLKSLEVGYTVPGIAKSGIQKLRVYVSGTNLLTWSKLKHFDPEMTEGSGSYYPQQRTFNIGASITF